MTRLMLVLRRKGVWLSAKDALVIRQALYRAQITTTEPGAETIKRFYIRCDELEKS